MITKFLTEISVKFNPFLPTSKGVRLFLTNLPANTRQSGISVNTTMLGRTATEPSLLRVKYKDGKELSLECDKMTVVSLVEEVDRHSRALQREATLAE